MPEGESNLSTIVGERSVRLKLAGHLDIYSAPMLDQWIRNQESRGLADLRIDVGNVTFVDPNGIRTLVDAAKRGQKEGRRVRVANLHDRVRLIFELSLSEVLLT